MAAAVNNRLWLLLALAAASMAAAVGLVILAAFPTVLDAQPVRSQWWWALWAAACVLVVLYCAIRAVGERIYLRALNLPFLLPGGHVDPTAAPAAIQPVSDGPEAGFVEALDNLRGSLARATVADDAPTTIQDVMRLESALRRADRRASRHVPAPLSRAGRQALAMTVLTIPQTVWSNIHQRACNLAWMVTRCRTHPGFAATMPPDEIACWWAALSATMHIRRPTDTDGVRVIDARGIGHDLASYEGAAAARELRAPWLLLLAGEAPSLAETRRGAEPDHLTQDDTPERPSGGGDDTAAALLLLIALHGDRSVGGSTATLNIPTLAGVLETFPAWRDGPAATA